MARTAPRAHRAWASIALACVIACVLARECAGYGSVTTAPPQISWLEPPQGHVAGGTTLAIYGGGFANSPSLTARFVRGTEVTDARATFHSSSMITVETPARNEAGWTQVIVSNDGEAFSGTPNVFTKGSGTFLAYVYDDSLAGFYDGVRQGINTNAYHETWTASNTTGPYIGGTAVVISATGLNLGASTLGSSEVYRGPTDGSGTPNPHFPDPSAPMNSPRIRGTFYPGKYLRCRMTCSIDVDGTGATSYVKDTPAIWLSYVAVRCETPPMPVPDGDPIPSVACKYQISNDGATYDTTYATFTYSDPIPTVSSISTSQNSVWGARGPFDGNTEVVVKGANFLPSKYLKCKFGGIPESGKNLWESDDVSHVVGEPGGRVRWISSTEIRCITPAFGPAAQLRQYPSDTTLIDSSDIIGSGAVLDVTMSGDAITAVSIVNAGAGYASAPVLTFTGGGGGGAAATATVTNGKISAVSLTSGGYSYNQGSGAAATATISNGVLVSIAVVNGGNGYRVPPEVTLSCSGTCLTTGGAHGSAVAVLGPADNCFAEYGCFVKKVIEVRIVTAGSYVSAPVVTFTPQKPVIQVRASELNVAAADPAAIGAYTMQGKGINELDPELDHGSWATGAYDISTASYDVVAVGEVTGTITGRRLAAAELNPSYRGLDMPSSDAASDGSIKPAHQDLVQVSNNYNKFGVPVTGNVAATPTHVGYRDNTATAKGYWMWSRDVGTPSDCAVSNNPPLNYYTNMLDGHNLDKGTGWLSSSAADPFLGVPGNADPGNPSKSCLYFLYGDIYVSPSGNDVTGHGTAARPYATIQKCIDASLSDARDYYPTQDHSLSVADRISSAVSRYSPSSSSRRMSSTRNAGYGYTVNRDRCILKDGTYWGRGNREFHAHHRVVHIVAENSGKVTIDCEGASLGKNVFAGARDPTRIAPTGSVSMFGIANKRCNFPGASRAADKPYYYAS